MSSTNFQSVLEQLSDFVEFMENEQSWHSEDERNLLNCFADSVMVSYNNGYYHYFCDV